MSTCITEYFIKQKKNSTIPIVNEKFSIQQNKYINEEKYENEYITLKRLGNGSSFQVDLQLKNHMEIFMTLINLLIEKLKIIKGLTIYFYQNCTILFKINIQLFNSLMEKHY